MPNYESFPVTDQWSYDIELNSTNLDTNVKTDLSFAVKIQRGLKDDYTNNPTKIVVEFEPDTLLFTQFRLNFKILF
jgi:hypothetical protein